MREQAIDRLHRRRFQISELLFGLALDADPLVDTADIQGLAQFGGACAQPFHDVAIAVHRQTAAQHQEDVFDTRPHHRGARDPSAAAARSDKARCPKKMVISATSPGTI